MAARVEASKTAGKLEPRFHRYMSYHASTCSICVLPAAQQVKNGGFVQLVMCAGWCSCAAAHLCRLVARLDTTPKETAVLRFLLHKQVNNSVSRARNARSTCCA